MEDTEILTTSAAGDIAEYLILVTESYAEQIEDIKGKIDFLDALKESLTGQSYYHDANDSGRIDSEISRLRTNTEKSNFDAMHAANTRRKPNGKERNEKKRRMNAPIQMPDGATTTSLQT